ncbi:hypothetical protein [Spirillospora sp. CA-294931]|uniref:hypothetical protein n=1 Tax=Spirillospora sp. CA-294931 TaxID=3240042 RepID=UPI003D8F946B
MSRDDVDRALERLRGERERIGASLLELEAHDGHRMLEGASLTGRTQREQAELRSRITMLWTLFDLYGGTLGAAEELRARHSKPGQAQLAELTRLLAGPSVELPAEEVPLERRTLLASPSGEKLTLQAVVERMTPLFEEAARMVAAVDGVWSALLTALEEAEAERRAVAALDVPDPEFARLERELDELARAVRTDPLSFGSDTSRFASVRDGLRRLRRTLAEVVQVREGFDERVRRVREVIADVRRERDEALRAREQVVAKIADPSLPDLPDLAASLDDRLSALRELRQAARWNRLAEGVLDLESAAADALEKTRTALGLVTGLLERRDELRGRLDAYRVKAARLGHAEDEELHGMYQEIRGVLWTSPCDLRKATVLLSRYQQAISSRAKGPT